MNIDSSIRGFLSDGGVDLVGFASAEQFSDWDSAFRARLKSGLLPARYSSRLGGNPGGFLAKARSIIVFGVPYDGLAEVKDPGRASIAGIAWARRKERALSSGLARFLVEAGFAAVDATGIPAKSAAVRAGLAAQRKNSLAYFNGAPGSAVRIGAVVTDLELEPAGAAAFEPCGDCTLCLDACPTGALVEEYVVEVERCLCYVLEHDSELPEDMRPVLSNRLVGCETCQLACPHNSDVPRLSLADVPWLDLQSLAAEAGERPDVLLSRLRDDLTVPVYSDYTPLRAIAIALGDWGDRRAVPLLCRLEASPMTRVAEAARWSLEKMGER
jgi:epoxyqueuosine reductase